MESNKVADDIRMKLLGLEWCHGCQMEVRPSFRGTMGDPGDPPVSIGFCDNCGCMTVPTKPDHMLTTSPHKETK
ncbi:hypothetical protein KAR91_61085 [Candidatus Pacearchaeota archaeon]|nr:hypothetical protein [Candidatus Pacearchaeota archaeon]